MIGALRGWLQNTLRGHFGGREKIQLPSNQNTQENHRRNVSSVLFDEDNLAWLVGRKDKGRCYWENFKVLVIFKNSELLMCLNRRVIAKIKVLKVGGNLLKGFV